MDKINEQKTIGEFLKDLRNEAKLSIRKEADLIGVDRRRISDWEKGISVPNLLEARELSRLYQVSIFEIANGKRENKTDSSQVCADPETPRSVEHKVSVKTKAHRQRRTKSQGLLDSLCEKINIILNEMTEDRKNTVAIMTLLVALFILAFCPVFSQGLKEPLTWVIAPIFIILELLAIKYLPDEWFEKKGRKEKKRE